MRAKRRVIQHEGHEQRKKSMVLYIHTYIHTQMKKKSDEDLSLKSQSLTKVSLSLVYYIIVFFILLFSQYSKSSSYYRYTAKYTYSFRCHYHLLLPLALPPFNLRLGRSAVWRYFYIYTRPRPMVVFQQLVSSRAAESKTHKPENTRDACTVYDLAWTLNELSWPSSFASSHALTIYIYRKKERERNKNAKKN